MDYTFHYDSPLGGITMASDGEALVGLWFDGQAHFGAALEDEHEPGSPACFDEALRWLDIYFGGGVPDFTPKLNLRGTAYQKAVWARLLGIAYGKTTTYGALAAEVARDMGRKGSAARAVGGAVGRNPIALIVPCHRVMGAKGALTGYAGGLDKKRWLLQMEGII